MRSSLASSLGLYFEVSLVIIDDSSVALRRQCEQFRWKSLVEYNEIFIGERGVANEGARDSCDGELIRNKGFCIDAQADWSLEGAKVHGGVVHADEFAALKECVTS